VNVTNKYKNGTGENVLAKKLNDDNRRYFIILILSRDKSPELWPPANGKTSDGLAKTVAEVE